MEPRDYGRMIKKLDSRVFELMEKRWELETQIKEIDLELKEIGGTLSHLKPLAGETAEQDSVAGLGLTNAIRKVLGLSEDRLSASNIRDELQKRGFNFSGYEMPGASIFTILYRLKKKGEITMEKQDGRRFFRWKHKLADLDEEHRKWKN